MEYKPYKAMFEPDLSRSYNHLDMVATSNNVRVNKQEMYSAGDVKANQVMLEEVESVVNPNYIYFPLATEPSDWETNYTNYYVYDGEGGYQQVTGKTAPEFEANKYFEQSIKQ